MNLIQLFKYEKVVDRLFTEPFNPHSYNAIMFTHRCTAKQSRKGYVNLVDSHSFICVVCNAYNNFKCFKQLCLDAQLEEKKSMC